MTPQRYVAMLHAAGIPRGIPALDLDQAAASLLRIDARTARRYRLGEQDVPGPVQVALDALAKLKCCVVPKKLL